MNPLFSPRELQQQCDEIRIESARMQGRIEVISSCLEREQRDKRFIVSTFMTLSSVALLAVIILFFRVHTLQREMEGRFEAARQSVVAAEKRISTLERQLDEQRRAQGLERPR